MTVVRGAGLGCALAGFGLLVAAQLLPWLSATTSPLQQDFPTSTGGRLERSLVELPLPTEIFNLGWLMVLGAVATALAVRGAARRVVVAAGLGLVGGELALLIGMTRTIKRSGLFRGTFPQTALASHLETGVYCAYAALVMFALALLLAGGVPLWLRRRATPATEAEPVGPADLTVTAAPTTDPALWARDPHTDIEVGGRQSER
ncbi:hypothetical protein [Planosporangium flavigriseum]|uniref:hypothetical protein n=1 Tax=Planosporangium flavigriseum TaxID=373681 RepID=UPI00194FC325|nr:hypothetical protein [Planosporangium flavigriseum]